MMTQCPFIQELQICLRNMEKHGGEDPKNTFGTEIPICEILINVYVIECNSRSENYSGREKLLLRAGVGWNP